MVFKEIAQCLLSFIIAPCFITGCLGQPVATGQEPTGPETDIEVTTEPNFVSTSDFYIVSPFAVVPTETQVTTPAPITTQTPVSIHSGQYIRLTGIVKDYDPSQRRFTLVSTVIQATSDSEFYNGAEYELANGICVEVRGILSYMTVRATRIKFEDDYCV